MRKRGWRNVCDAAPFPLSALSDVCRTQHRRCRSNSPYLALETLVHPRILLVSELLGDHRKMFHEVTRRRQMTLHAFFGSGGRMLIAAHRPRLEAVALRAVGSEPLKVRILTIMASGAVENLAGGTFFELTGALNPEPGL